LKGENWKQISLRTVKKGGIKTRKLSLIMVILMVFLFVSGCAITNGSEGDVVESLHFFPIFFLDKPLILD